MMTDATPEPIPAEKTDPEGAEWTPPLALRTVLWRRAMQGLPVLLVAWVALVAVLASVANARH